MSTECGVLVAVFCSGVITDVVDYGCLATQQQQQHGVWRAAAVAAAWRVFEMMDNYKLQGVGVTCMGMGCNEWDGSSREAV